MAEKMTRLVWIDLEMTGLDTQKDEIIEIATLVTTADLEIVAEGPVIVIHQPDEVLSAMDEWNQNTHGGTGLIDRVKESRIGVKEAEAQTLAFLAEHVAPDVSPMCGNSICQDRRFMARLMPDLEAFFHYRNLDVSTLKELARRWAPEVTRSFTKATAHQALEDIYESVNELRHYREHFLRLPDPVPTDADEVDGQ